MKKMIHPAMLFTAILFPALFFASCHHRAFEEKQIRLWETAEWSIGNPSFEGNPFDLVAEVTFTHQDNGEIRITQMFYDGGKTWKFRFMGTGPGRWKISTTAGDKDLNGRSGFISVAENPDPEARANGPVTGFGNKWGWQGSQQAFIPQYVMGKDLDYFYDFETGQVAVERIGQDIEEFIHGHGFTGFHLGAQKRCFDITGEGPFVDPDVRSYRVLETIISRVREEGGACHLWMWGSDGPRDRTDGSGPRGILGAAGNQKDLRNLRYMAARLGPLPGWTIGYGVDTENGVATADQLDNWKAYLEEHMGWDHFIGARVGYDEKGLWALRPPPPPLRPLPGSPEPPP